MAFFQYVKHIIQRQGLFSEQDKQVIQQVCRFPFEFLAVPVFRGDDDFGCFFSDFFQNLIDALAYTTYLFREGVDKILKKVGEEASEVIIAAKNRGHEELKWDSCQCGMPGRMALQVRSMRPGRSHTGYL